MIQEQTGGSQTVQCTGAPGGLAEVRVGGTTSRVCHSTSVRWWGSLGRSIWKKVPDDVDTAGLGIMQ